MCLERCSCLCHLIQPAIENDHKERLKLFFSRSLNTELYLFLKTAYEIKNKQNNKLLRDSLGYLIRNFINKGAYEINISFNLKDSFLKHYDAFSEGEITKEYMLKELSTLIQYIERLSYLNLVDSAGFKDFLLMYNEVPKDPEDIHMHYKKNKCSLI